MKMQTMTQEMKKKDEKMITEILKEMRRKNNGKSDKRKKNIESEQRL